MEIILNFLRSDIFLIIISLISFILFILYIIEKVNLHKINKNYQKFMKKLGNGTDIDEMLKKYIDRVEEISKENKEIENYCKKLDSKAANCIQKIGLIRYSAFEDTGSDLSFALAILNEYNTGFVLNGIYSREMSNIYAKPVDKGKSTYTLSEEEIAAIDKAIKGRILTE